MAGFGLTLVHPRHVRNFNDSRLEAPKGASPPWRWAPVCVHLCGIPREIIHTSEGEKS